MKRKRVLASVPILLAALLFAGCMRALAPEFPPEGYPEAPAVRERVASPSEEAAAEEPSPGEPADAAPEEAEPEEGGGEPAPAEEPQAESGIRQEAPTAAEPPSSAEPWEESQDPSEEFEPKPLKLREPNEFVLTFAGDCTFGKDHGFYSVWDFPSVVGEDYDYPFASVRKYFADDDFTMVNLEGALTDYNVPMQKTYRFRGPPAYAKILSGSSVEGVTLANNHSGDYGQQGLSDTHAALDAEGILYADDGGSFLVETKRGLKIGFCAFFWNGWNQQQAIRDLREAGAQLVVAFWHWGDEGTYSVNGNQTGNAHAAIDAGADLVIGSHPHVLQRIEQYGNGVIAYSLGNFSFGGNTNPRDKDTVVFRQHVFLNEDGTVSLGETELIPCRLSSVTDRNDYQPTPYEPGTAEYERVLAKLNGTYR